MLVAVGSGNSRSCIAFNNSAITPMADRVIHIKNGTVESMQCNEHPTSVELIEW